MVHVNSSSKNAADAKLEELIDMFIHKFGSNSVLVVITGDINFAKPIRSARRKDITVVLIHGTNCSQDLRNSVNESYLFDDLIKDVENVNQNNAIEITPGFYCHYLLIITDLLIKMVTQFNYSSHRSFKFAQKCLD